MRGRVMGAGHGWAITVALVATMLVPLGAGSAAANDRNLVASLDALPGVPHLPALPGLPDVDRTTPDLPKPGDGIRTARAVLDAGASLSTDGGGTPNDPLGVTVTTPAAGAVSIQESAAGTRAFRTMPIPREVAITGPLGSVDQPGTIRFTVHDSVVPPEADTDVLRVLFAGETLPPCAGDGARPDPCVSDLRRRASSTQVTVRASNVTGVWRFAVDQFDRLCDAAPAPTFLDVAAGDAHAPAIGCAASLGIVGGVSAYRFDPARRVTRGQMATLLAAVLQMSGVPLEWSVDAFRDDDATVHDQATNALAAMGIVNGVAPDRFGPHRHVTRAQAAELLFRTYTVASGELLPGGPDAFNDDNGSVHEVAINATARAGITTGTQPRQFAPDRPLRRDAAAALVMRMLESLDRAGVELMFGPS